MKKALITGITGQDGSYLADLLIKKGYEVHGVLRRSSTCASERIDHLGRGNLGDRHLRLHYGDLSDAESLITILGNVQPDEVYNLAAQSHVGISFTMPTYTGEVSGLGVVRLLEAVRQVVPSTRFYQASSSELFGMAIDTPQREDTPFRPRSPYAVAKLYAYWATVNYREAHGLFAANGLLFNHESPRRGENFVTRKISRAVAEIATGMRGSVSLGNLEARRDWGFAGDFVDAMWRILQAEEPDDWVVGTGKDHSVREFCEHAFAHVGIGIEWQGSGIDEVGHDRLTGAKRVIVDPTYFRPADIDRLVADSSKARRELGWRPKVGFQQLVGMMVDADMRLLGRFDENCRMCTEYIGRTPTSNLVS
jgi:GDPmannose 4,6-dehydratase